MFFDALCSIVVIVLSLWFHLNIISVVNALFKVDLIILQFLFIVMSSCNFVCNIRILLFSLFMGVIAAWSRWTMTSDGSVPLLINIDLGNGVRCFEKLETQIGIGKCAQALKVPDAGRPILFCNKLNCVAMPMSPALLVYVDTDPSALKSTSTLFKILDHDVLSVLSRRSWIFDSAYESLCNIASGSDRAAF